ncbi:hypothetical protein WICMUC_000605 [Wickerhamomyces mucosus]|uniref:Importin-95 n=1 Tax=Wickerhamomyces mucosus TaxID=1378264 RepID=A0A9P8PWN6_9ASCO|nr:hypothetical protein WICMUC_000605 [Wickerhamomyces mucosus]
MDISRILEDAILSPDPATRAEAESQLQILSKEQFVNYIGLLTQTLADDSKRVEVRILAGINLKNELTSKDKNKKAEQAQRWISLDPVAKEQIKQIALSSLLTENDRVANAGAQLVAAIADIELPRQEWNDLIGIIVENTKPEKPEHVKRSSLLTIGYICETADANDKGVASQSNGILIAIVQGAQSSEPSKVVRLTALNALVDSLEFIKSNFDSEGERNFIMQVVCEATQADDNEIQAAAFGALARIMSLYYPHMSVYMEKALFGLTVSGMKSQDERVACMAVEFWSTVCENEIDIALEKEEYPDSNSVSYNFALVAITEVLPTLFTLLTRQNDDPDDDTWNVAMAAGACLQLFAQDTGNYVVEPTLKFVESNISSPEWRNREAAVMSFGSILDGPDREQLKVLIGQALGPILSLITDSNLQVKETVAWCIGRIADLIIDAIDVEQHLPNVVGAVIQGLKDHGKVSTNSCWTLINIVEQLNNSFQQEDTSPMSQYYPALVPILLEVSGRADNEYSARASAYEALSTLVLYSSKDTIPVVNEIAREILSRVETTITLQTQVVSAEDKSNLEELQSNILSLLTNIIRRYGNEINNVADHLMELLLKLLQANANSIIEEDVFSTISALASSIEGQFNKYMGAFLPFLTNALNQIESPVSNTAVGLVADISHSLGDSFKQYAEGLINILGQLLQNNNGRKELKPAVLSAFGDIATSIGGLFKPYLQVVFNICHEAQNSQPENSSIEALDYNLSVRESVLDCYVGIVGGLHSEGDSIFPYVGQIFELLNIISNEASFALSDSITRSAIGLIGDLAQIYPDGRIKQAYEQEWITQFIKKARTNPTFSQTTHDTARWAREQQKNQINL